VKKRYPQYRHHSARLGSVLGHPDDVVVVVDAENHGKDTVTLCRSKAGPKYEMIKWVVNAFKLALAEPGNRTTTVRKAWIRKRYTTDKGGSNGRQRDF
jgi:hypothetical protein